MAEVKSCWFTLCTVPCIVPRKVSENFFGIAHNSVPLQCRIVADLRAIIQKMCVERRRGQEKIFVIPIPF